MKRQVALSALLALLATSSALAKGPETTTISVAGTGTVAIVPDQATIDASVVTTAASATDAIAENNRRYDAVSAAAVGAGVARSDIALSYYNVNYVPKPAAGAQPNPYDRYGYTVTRSFAIVVRSIGKAGAVVDAIAAAGATTIGNASFGVAHPESARKRAAERAVADARAKASDLAAAAGLRITGIATMELDGAAPIRPVVMAKMAAPAPTTFDPGDVNVSVSVTVTFLAAP